MNMHDQLMRPFEAHKISWRIGSTTRDKSKGMPLAYIDARDVMKRLDDVVGAENWQCRYPLAAGNLLICEIGVKMDGEWVWKSNGAGDTAVEADKGKCSDAFKRAAVLWGIGRYLYSLPNKWVDLEMHNNRPVIPKATLIRLGEELPHWATPEGYDKLIAKKEESK